MEQALIRCVSPKLRPNEKSCDPPARAAGQNYLTIGRALEKLGVFEPRAELWRKPAGKSNPFASVPVLIIRQLGRSDGASRPGALETRLYPDPWTEPCPPAFPFLAQVRAVFMIIATSKPYLASRSKMRNRGAD